MMTSEINKYIWDELNSLDGFAHLRKLQEQQPDREFWVVGGLIRNILIKKTHGYLPTHKDIDVLVDDRNDKIFERPFDFRSLFDGSTNRINYNAERNKKLENYKYQINKLKPVVSTKIRYDFFVVSNHFMRINYNKIKSVKTYIENFDFHMNSCMFSVKNKKFIATDGFFNAIEKKDINMIWSGVNCKMEMSGFMHNNLIANYKLFGRIFVFEIKLGFTLNDEVLDKLNSPIDDTNPQLLKETIDLKLMCNYIRDRGYGKNIDDILTRFFNI